MIKKSILIFFILSASLLATEYRMMNGKLEPINPLDQSEDVVEIDNVTIVHAVLTLQSEISFLKHRIRKMDNRIERTRQKNNEFGTRMDKFLRTYDRQF